jgi:hypothetical protein
MGRRGLARVLSAGSISGCCQALYSVCCRRSGSPGDRDAEATFTPYEF